MVGWACAVVLLAGCTAGRVPEAGRAGAMPGDAVAELRRVEQALKDDPGNMELRSQLIRQREMFVDERIVGAERAQAARQFDQAEALYRQALDIDPLHPRARLGLEALAGDRRRVQRLAEARAALAAGDHEAAMRVLRGVLAEAPGERSAQEMVRELEERALRQRAPLTEALAGPLANPVSLEFKDAPLRIVFEALARASGLNFVFDKDMRADSRVTLFVRDTSIDEVIRLLVATQGIERKLLNPNTVLIYPATTAKQREHVDLVTRGFYLANADAKSAQTMLKQLVKSRDVFIDEKLNLLVVKDTPDAVRLAERMIALLDVSEPEVMLELEVLEVSRSKLRDLGLDLPDQIGYGLLTPNLQAGSQIVNGVVISGTTQLGGRLLDGNVDLRDTGDLVPFVTNPAAVLRLRSENGDSSLLANPRIRVRNRDKAKIHIGDKLPVFTTTATANVGVSASVAYLDVGLKLEVEPSVYRDDEVGIKVNLEVSSIVKEVPGPSNSLAYQVGTRSATTSLRLRNGHTQVLAGLINDEERSLGQGLPGMRELPLLGRLFNAQRDSSSKTEIVLLITPRIVRNVLPPASYLADVPAGTDAAIGAEPLRLGRTGRVGLAGEGGAVAPAPLAMQRSAIPQEAPAREAASTETENSIPVPLIQLDVPDSVRRGEEVRLGIRMEGLGNAASGELSVVYDLARVEPVPPPPVPGMVKLPVAPVDGEADAELVLRVKPDAGGGASVVVTGLNLHGAAGEQAIPLSSGATLRIVE